MSGLIQQRQRLRERAELHLRLAAMRDLARRTPGAPDVKAPPGGLLWRGAFVPLYRRLPWGFKAAAMKRLGMTATGWTPPSRRPGEPWRPP